MINLPVDEGYAYDYLAILWVKKIKGIDDGTLYHSYSQFISKQVGRTLHDEIINSPEFGTCLKVNEATFDSVDKAKVDSVPASVVHNLNYERYVAKTALQKRFFPESEVTEKKN